MRTSGLEDSNNWRLWTGYDYVAEQVTNHHRHALVAPIVFVEWRDTIDDSKLVVDYFYSKDVQYTISPALQFEWVLNRETGFLEITGTGVYEDILVYGDSLKQAMAVLQEGILPLLWEDCVTKNDVRLTARASRIASDLKSRVAT